MILHNYEASQLTTVELVMHGNKNPRINLILKVNTPFMEIDMDFVQVNNIWLHIWPKLLGEGCH